MIRLSRLNKKEFFINDDWIEMIEATPDSVITLTNGKKFVVSESVDEIVQRVVEFRQRAGFGIKTIHPAPENADND